MPVSSISGTSTRRQHLSGHRGRRLQSGDERTAASGAVAPSARAGDVWEVDSASNRATVEPALRAYVNGLHVMVVDDNDSYAGMTHLAGTPNGAGARTYTLGGGTSVRLARSGDTLALTFPDGAAVPLRRRPADTR